MQRMQPEVAHLRDHTGILIVNGENGQTRPRRGEQPKRAGQITLRPTPLFLVVDSAYAAGFIPSIVCSCVSFVFASEAYAHDWAGGAIGISGGETGTCCRLEQMAGTFTVLDCIINRRVRRIIVQSYS
jgi:hypothetical protein